MKAKTMSNPITDTLTDVLQHSREAIVESLMAKDRISVKKSTVRWLGTGLLLAGLAKIVHVVYCSAKCASDRKKVWKKSEASLDRDLESTMDASDAIAKY